ncbi:hypothetical protein [Paraburkholderia terrae]|uniref:hypothetical protein n=1 Tax=Paraburkholderia terrae TaxID=311230 RepID=UPI001EE2F6FF|nr:hypothetical protein [Paraburkholderia terrae]GJH02779.1 hypothetical protein CBA19C8_19500 [Paraburkholderia terrae]
MSVILEAEMAIEALLNEFQAANLPSELVEELPAVPEWNLPADAHVDIHFKADETDAVVQETDEVVIVWVSHKNRMVRMRAVVFRPEEIKGLGLTERDWAEKAKSRNQIAHFGTLCLVNPLGVTVEYSLPYHGGVFGEGLIFAAKALAENASSVRSLCTSMSRRRLRDA